MKNLILPFSGTMTLLLLLVSCGWGCKKDDATPDPDPRVQQDIDDYLGSLQYDPAQLFNVQGSGATQPSRSQQATHNPTYTAVGNDRIVCRRTDYNLTNNFDEVAILRPTNGIVFPGALVKANASLLDGLPEPITLERAPVTLRVDLPGIGEGGTLVVEKPTNASVQTAIDDALEAWNSGPYQEGYVNAASSSYESTYAYSSEQLSIDLGFSLQWARGSVATELSQSSSTERRIAMTKFQQAFYTVSMETPTRPSAVFGARVNAGDVQGVSGENTLPAYIQAVTYGRILLFRMETSAQASSTEVDLALQYATGLINASGSAKTAYEKILRESSISLITIGGNAEAAVEPINAQSTEELLQKIKTAITGKNAVYTRENPGVPIAYAVRLLSDNKLVKLGYTTDYSAVECVREYGSQLYIRHEAGYVARYTTTYRLDGKNYTKKSGDRSAGFNYSLDIPAGSTNIRLRIERAVFIGTWNDSFTHNIPSGESRCYKIWGTTLVPAWCYKIDGIDSGSCTDFSVDCNRK